METIMVTIDLLTAYERAWKQQLSFQDLLQVAEALGASGAGSQAAILYHIWLRRTQGPQLHIAWFNFGALLFSEGDLAGARDAYQQALKLAPGFVQPRFNLGLTYERLGQPDLAVNEWRVIDDSVSPSQEDQKPLLIMALNNLGRLLEEKKHYYAAHDYLVKSLMLNPEQSDVLHHLVYLREKMCAWPVYFTIPGVRPELMKQSTSALAMIGLSDDPQEQLDAAKQYVKTKVRSDVPALRPEKTYGHKKIRIGYCSSDFCMHPVSMLTVQLFELHNRDEFEVYGFCWTRQGHSALRQRVMDAMDHFIRIDEMSDEAAAKKIRECEIDILVDLHGQTLGARANMLAYRPAPIQITYLGLPATTGLPSIDYVIADRFLIPAEHVRFYSEKPLYMPDVYQVSDRKRQSTEPPTREQCGLPADAFVFCSFNNNYKYTPEMFEAWMNILRRTPESVLWLLADNPYAQENLKREARLKGVEASRLIFATRVLPEQYLARYAVADLFLDSFPFNAGTTANDALWMGLPVLTRTGRTFASRMAGALLTAAGLPELITYDVKAYEEKAVELAANRSHCRKLREHLQSVREQGVLFDTPRFVRHLEQRLQSLMESGCEK